MLRSLLALHAVPYQRERGGRVAPSDDPHVLAFQGGCCNRERLQFLTHARGHSRQIREAQFPTGIERNRQDAVVTNAFRRIAVPSILFNLQDADRATWNNHAWKRRDVPQQQGIQRVAVAGLGRRHESPVEGE